MLLTQSTAPIIGWIATLMGYIMQGIYNVLSSVGIENVGLCIIIFTIIIRILLLPMMVQQQKFTKINSVMQPEINKIQKKYRGKKDSVSMQRQQEEIQAVYDKYGTNATAGCAQLLIQMPVLLALYQVIRKIPAYIPAVKAEYTTVVTAITGVSGYADKVNKVIESLGSNYVKAIDASSSVDTIIDQLNYFNATAWKSLADAFPSVSNVITDASHHIIKMNDFVAGINVSQTPGFRPSILWIIPILAGLFQFLSAKTMRQPDTGNDQAAGMTRSMTTIMPLMSVYFCLIMPVGLGLYWIMSALLQFVQQIALNQYFDHVDLDTLVAKNREKAAKKKAKGKKSLTERIAEKSKSAEDNEGVIITREENPYRTIKGNASIKAKVIADPFEGKKVNYDKLGEIGKSAHIMQEYEKKQNSKGGNQ